MAISTDTSLNFNSSTGYTIFEINLGDLVFSGGAATLSAGTKAAAVRTPSVDTSAFTSLLSVVATTTEAVGFDFRFLVSFDDWSNAEVRQRYFTWIAGSGWVEVADFTFPAANLLTTAEEKGLRKIDLAEVRDWPPVGSGSSISFLVWMDRASGGGNAGIDQITISYGTEAKAVVGSETSIGTLAFQPNEPINFQYRQTFDEIEFSKNYKQLIERGTSLRRSGSLTWGPLNSTDAGTLRTFLISAMNTHFDWQPITEPSSAKWKVATTPQLRQAGIRDLYEITANVVEYFS